MALKPSKWDVVDHLKTDEDMAMYLEAAMEEAGDDAAFIAKVLGDIARAKMISAFRLCNLPNGNWQYK